MKITINTRGHLDKYPAKAHARRVAEELGSQQGFIILVAEKARIYPNSDLPVPFRQNRYFYYLSGCNEPDCYIVYDTRKDKLTLWLPPIAMERIVWAGRGSTVEEALEKYDIDDANYLWNEDAKLDAETVGSSIIWCISALPHNQLFKKSFQMPTSSAQREKASLHLAMDTCRVVKDKYEIALVRKANDITAAAHVTVLKNLHKFKNEAEVEAAFMQVCIAQHAKEQSYAPIAGAGSNGAVLHYTDNSANFGDGQTLVLDAGCEVSCYASDVTRTLPLNRARPGHWPSKEAENIYKLVEKVQESCIKQLRPGHKFIETEWHARYVTIEGLIELGILRGEPKEILLAGTSFALFPHGLGHFVGLDVHDVSPALRPPLLLSQNRQHETAEPTVDRTEKAYVGWDATMAISFDYLKRPEQLGIAKSRKSPPFPSLNVDGPGLKPGMIITIEPGIYFNSFLLNQFLKDPKHKKHIDEEVLKRYEPVGGVRIEDDILITKDGYENLTTAPKGEKMLGVIREAAKIAGF